MLPREKMKPHAGLLFAFLIITAACSTHRGIKPIEPEVGHYSPTVVANLTPTFRWEPLTEPDSKYDFAVFEVLESGQASEAIYYREGLTTAEHTLQESLKPGTNYYWSVRSRRGATAGEWTTYDHTLFVPIPFGFIIKARAAYSFLSKHPTSKYLY
jgi:hypothetical protein